MKKKKRAYEMKPFKRKSGGGRFRMVGDAKFRAPSAPTKPSVSELGLLADLLSKMGFRTKSRQDANRYPVDEREVEI